MGQTVGKKGKKMASVPEEHQEKYVRSEFKAMAADNDDPNVLSRQQVLDLLVMLGYSKGKDKLKYLHVKNEDSIELEDYVEKFLEDKALIAKTSRYRDVFQYFDKDNDGTASKEEIINGLESMGINVDKAMQDTVKKMDANDDGKITYEEYLRMEISMKLKK